MDRAGLPAAAPAPRAQRVKSEAGPRPGARSATLDAEHGVLRCEEEKNPALKVLREPESLRARPRALAPNDVGASTRGCEFPSAQRQAVGIQAPRRNGGNHPVSASSRSASSARAAFLRGSNRVAASMDTASRTDARMAVFGTLPR